MSKSINLLPDPILDTNRQISSLYQGTVLTLIGVILFVLINLTVLFLSIRAENSLTETQDQIQTVQQELQGLQVIEEKLLTIQDKLLRYERFKDEHVAFGDMWDLIIGASEQTVTLVTVEYVKETGLITVAQANDLTQAVDFLVNLKQTDLLTDFTVTEITYDHTDNEYEFVTSFAVGITEPTP